LAVDRIFEPKNMNPNIVLPWFAKCPRPVVAFSILFAGVFFIAGCGKKPAASAQNQAAPTADNSQTPSNSEVATAASPAADPASVTTSHPAATGEPAAPDLSPLTQALHIYIYQHKGMPKTFADLVAAGNVKNMPALPPGKQFEIDPKTTQVILVNQ
jgi:hypothetical protein